MEILGTKDILVTIVLIVAAYIMTGVKIGRSYKNDTLDDKLSKYKQYYYYIFVIVMVSRIFPSLEIATRVLFVIFVLAFIMVIKTDFQISRDLPVNKNKGPFNFISVLLILAVTAGFVFNS